MKVLVTGGAGFIGSAFVRAAEAAGHRVMVIDKLTYAGRADNIHECHASLYRADITDANKMHGLFKTLLPDAVVHFAAESHVDASFLSRRLFMQTNALGTDVILEAARIYGVSKFVHISTDEVFGSLPTAGLQLPEGAQLAPRNPYAASKAAAEMVVSAFRETYKYPAMMVRFSNCFGPRQHWEKLIPITISRIIHGLPAVIHSDGKQTREWLPVDVAAEGVLRVLHDGKLGTTYNLPGTVIASVREVVDILAEILMRYKPAIVNEGDREGGTDRHYGMSGARAREALGWAPQYSLCDELIRTVAWYMLNPSWLAPDKTRAGAAKVAAINS